MICKLCAKKTVYSPTRLISAHIVQDSLILLAVVCPGCVRCTMMHMWHFLIVVVQRHNAGRHNEKETQCNYLTFGGCSAQKCNLVWKEIVCAQSYRSFFFAIETEGAGIQRDTPGYIGIHVYPNVSWCIPVCLLRPPYHQVFLSMADTWGLQKSFLAQFESCLLYTSPSPRDA